MKFFNVILAAMLLAINPATAQGQGYLLSVWSGTGNAQTHAITTFEGPNARTRCEAAAAAMRRHNSRFNNSMYTTCIEF